MGYSLGIDVGTTYTAVGIGRSGRAEIAPLGARGWSVPSVVYLGADQIVLVGEPAVRRSTTDPLRVVREFKRRIGDPVPIMVGGAPVSADALTGMVLRDVTQQVVALETGPPEHIVITHPANWGPYKIDYLWQAIRFAALDKLCAVTLMSEPEAAAIYYASTEHLSAGDIIAVYDLGGGTFDAAVLRRTDTGWEFPAPAEGIERLGGIDFDEAVLSHVDAATDGRLRDLDPADTAAMAALQQLRRDCVDAKEALSSDIATTIRVTLPPQHTGVRLTRTEFESMIEPSVRLSVDAMRRVLHSAGLSAEQLHAVLLVGGSSRIPLVSQIVAQSLHVPVAIDAHPKHSIALGAALTADQRAQTRAIADAPVATAALPVTPVDSSARHAAPDGRGAGDQGQHRNRRRLLAVSAVAAVLAVGGIAAYAAAGPSEITGSGVAGALPTAVSAPTSPSLGSTSGPSTNPTTEPTTQSTAAESSDVVAKDNIEVMWESDRTSTERSIWQATLQGGIDRASVVDSVVVVDSLTPPLADAHPAFSPQGDLLYLHRPTADDATWDLMVSAADGSGARKIVDSVARTSRPSWAPDGKAVLVPLPGTGGRNDLWRIDIDTLERQQLLQTPEDERDPVLSPDGARLAFRRDMPPDADPEIFVLDLASGVETRLTTHVGYDSDPQFSPDGKTILFSREFEPDNVEIATMSSTAGDAGTVERLTEAPGMDQDPAWTPDGTTIAFTSHRDGEDGEIYLMRADGSDQQRLTINPGYDGVPHVRAR